jgi:hypothetical protein
MLVAATRRGATTIGRRFFSSKASSRVRFLRAHHGAERREQ